MRSRLVAGRPLAAVPRLALLAGAGPGGPPIRSAPLRATSCSRSPGHLGAPHGRRRGRDPAGRDPLTLGLNDVLVLRNLDDVPQVFGPTLMMPGQSFRLPFEQASTYSSPAPRMPAGR